MELFKSVMLLLFLIYFISGYIFILSGFYYLFIISVIAGIMPLPVILLNIRATKNNYFFDSIPMLILLISSLIISIIFYLGIGYNLWAKDLTIVFFYPVISEEIFFRYFLQNYLMKNLNSYFAILLQALVYSIYYSKYIVLDGGKGFPVPYNILFVLSVFSIGIFYGIIAHVTKSIYISSTIHFIIWASFPFLAIYLPGIASTIVPS